MRRRSSRPGSSIPLSAAAACTFVPARGPLLVHGFLLQGSQHLPSRTAMPAALWWARATVEPR
jgi:hypothetical protein